jgi:NIMA (never in mitosis gene a)-related kinase
MVQSRENGDVYVCKRIPLHSLNENEKKNALQEANLLRDMKHPFIVQYVDSFIEDSSLVIIMEYCSEGDLTSHIKKMKANGSRFSEDVVLNWMSQIVLALKYLHSCKILHRDLKSSNLMMTADGNIKIGDFGIAKVLEGSLEHAQTIIGTPYYMSPELMENKPYSFKSDVWSVGCIIYELCALDYPFKGSNIIELMGKILNSEPESIPKNYSEHLQELISFVLQKEPANRPTIEQLGNHQYLQPVISALNDQAKSSVMRSPKVRLPSSNNLHSSRNGPERNSNQGIMGLKSQIAQMVVGAPENNSKRDSYLTPIQLLKKKKEQEALKKEEETRKSGLVEKLADIKSRKFEHMRMAFGSNTDNSNSSRKMGNQFRISSGNSNKSNPKIESDLIDTMQRNLEDTIVSQEFDEEEEFKPTPKNTNSNSPKDFGYDIGDVDR